MVPGQGHADGQAAARGGDLAELIQDGLQDGRLQVDGNPFEQEQAGRARVEPGREQAIRQRVPGEIGLDEPDLGHRDAQSRQPVALVPLGRGMIHFEPADAGLGVPQRPAVIAGRAHHDLPHAAADGGHHQPVEERRARG